MPLAGAMLRYADATRPRRDDAKDTKTLNNSASLELEAMFDAIIAGSVNSICSNINPTAFNRATDATSNAV